MKNTDYQYGKRLRQIDGRIFEMTEELQSSD
jgi:hypothetical protein